MVNIVFGFAVALRVQAQTVSHISPLYHRRQCFHRRLCDVWINNPSTPWRRRRPQSVIERWYVLTDTSWWEVVIVRQLGGLFFSVWKDGSESQRRHMSEVYMWIYQNHLHGIRTGDLPVTRPDQGLTNSIVFWLGTHLCKTFLKNWIYFLTLLKYC